MVMIKTVTFTVAYSTIYSACCVCASVCVCENKSEREGSRATASRGGQMEGKFGMSTEFSPGCLQTNGIFVCMYLN